jgi:hypothetical protein
LKIQEDVKSSVDKALHVGQPIPKVQLEIRENFKLNFYYNSHSPGKVS